MWRTIERNIKEGWRMGVVVGLFVAILFLLFYRPGASEGFLEPAIVTGNIFYYPFNSSGTLYEAGSMNLSTSPYWWLDSGGKLIIHDDIGMTVAGALAADDPWRVLYDRNNPVDTDNGMHPQNIFRLVTRARWANSTEEAFFNIDRYNLSASPNRNQSNGILLFTRYADHDNLYYAGLRVDGNAVIKKKIGGIYHTLALVKVLPGRYNDAAGTSLIPVHEWIGMRLVAVDTDDGHVGLQLYTDMGRTGTWSLVAQATDDGMDALGAPFAGAGYSGIRTDFMDVSFDDFRVTRM